MSTQPRLSLSPQEYLAIERKAQAKSEYFAGEMFAMAGTSRAHSFIVGNVARLLGNQFQGRPCEVHSTELRVKVSQTGLYTYPDVLALCGKAEMEDRQADTLLNPQLIVEVLSDSTEAYDRGPKFRHYQKLNSLQEYVLIAQDRFQVERYRRHEEGDWLMRVYLDADEVVELTSVNATLRLADIYERVEFEIEEEHPGTPD